MQRTLSLIKAVRFPLIVMVLIAHSLGFTGDGISLSADGWNVFRFVSEGISHNLCRIAVCTFFIFSGFFFFYGKEGEVRYDLPWYAGKWKRRIFTVLIPFLAWNAIQLLAALGKMHAFSALGIEQTDESAALLGAGPLYWFFTGPADFPLWYMRDMAIMILLSPALPPLFKFLGKFAPAVLILLYLSPWNPAIPSMRAIFFFCMGAWLGIRRMDMLQLCRKVRTASYIIAPLLLITATCFTGRPGHELAQRVFFPFGIIVFMNVCDSLTRKESTLKRLSGLSEYVFFIYAAHEVLILGWTKGLFARFLGEGLAAAWISYLLVPVVVLAVCIILYRIFKLVAPKPLAFICGGRA